jgi:maltose/maltodextrin transport system substrate-binding protein
MTLTRRDVVLGALTSATGALTGPAATAQVSTNSGQPSAPAPAVAAGRVSRTTRPLNIWFTVEGAKALRAIGERFTADTGVPVVVDTPDSEGPSKFQQAAAAGKGADLMVYAHDRIGEWVAGGILHAVEPPQSFLDDMDPLALKGFTYRGRLWGWPMAIEAATLVYNQALIDTPPRSFDDVFTLDAQLQRQGKRAMLWDYVNPYFTWPLLAANGGYPFKQREDGTFDARDTGVNNAGALQGARLLQRLLREGLMPSGSGYPEMEAAMAQGRVAMMINGPWSWLNLQRVGMNFGIANIPRVGQRAAAPFVGVKGVVMSRATRQRELATAFVEQYMLSPWGLRLINAAEPLGAVASRAYFQTMAGDARIAGIMASARDGAPTPSIPAMGRFWAAMKSSLITLTDGRQDAQQAMDAAARRILA